MKRITAAVLILLAACASTTEGEPPAGGPAEPAAGQECNADGLQDLVGRPATAELGAEALQRSHARTLRWVRPNSVITMDYSAQRLNINLDAQDRVERFTCG